MNTDFDDFGSPDYNEEIEEIKALLDDAEDLDAFLFLAQVESTARTAWGVNPEGEQPYPTDLFGAALIAMAEVYDEPIENLLQDIIRYVNWRRDSDIPLFKVQ